MATEITTSKYYDAPRYVNTHLCQKIVLECFLNNVLFKNDKNRVLYSTEDMCFRRRVETAAGKGYKEDDPINLVTLNLPFASYYQSSNFEEDDRAAALTASMMLTGDYEKYTGNKLRAMAVKATYKVSCFYTLDSDARIAYQALQWEKNPKGPIWMTVTVDWYGVYLRVPCFATIEDIKFNPDYKESDWLTKSRIIPVTAEITMRSYTLRLDELNKSKLPFRWQGIHDEYENQDYSQVILAEKVTLDWLTSKDLAEEVSEEDLEFNNRFVDDISPYAKRYFEPPRSPYVISGATQDIIGSYYSEQPGPLLKTCSIEEETEDSIKLKIKIDPLEKDDFDHIQILIEGHDPIVIDDPCQVSVVIDGLENNSEYKIIVLTYRKGGGITTNILTGKTKDSPDNQAPNPDGEKDKCAPDDKKITTAGKKHYPGLVGLEF